MPLMVIQSARDHPVRHELVFRWRRHPYCARSKRRQQSSALYRTLGAQPTRKEAWHRLAQPHSVDLPGTLISLAPSA